MKKSTTTQRLKEFIYYDEVPPEVIKDELQAEGVDVPASLDRVHKAVRKAKQQNIIAAAKHEKIALEEKVQGVNILSLPIEKIKALLDRAANGEFGICGQQFVLAHRNSNGKESEEELRSLAEDLLLLSGDSDEENTGDS